MESATNWEPYPWSTRTNIWLVTLQKHEGCFLPLNCNCGNQAELKQPSCFGSVWYSSFTDCAHMDSVTFTINQCMVPCAYHFFGPENTMNAKQIITVSRRKIVYNVKYLEVF